MADILREFLVGLGFKIDEASWKKFTGAVASAGKTTAELGSVAVEAATAIELAVAKVARQYESLYYVSRRTNQSATYIQSAGYAYRQMGLSADDATDAIESVAHAMRTTPGLAAIFGGATKPEDITEQLRGLAESSSVGYAVAAQLAGMAGLSEKVFQHQLLFGPQERRAAEEHRARLQEAGLDADKFAARVAGGPGSFTWALNQFEDNLGILETRIAADWIDPTQRGITALDSAVQWFNRADKATQGWYLSLGQLGSIAVTLTGLFGLEKILSRLFGFGGATASGALVSKLFKGGGLVGMARMLLSGGLVGGAGLMAAMKADDLNPEHPLKHQLRELFGIEDTGEEEPKPAHVPIGDALRQTFGLQEPVDHSPMGGPESAPAGRLSTSDEEPTPTGRPSTTTTRWNAAAHRRGAASRVDAAINFFVGQGYSREAAIGIASGLYLESDRTLSPTAFNAEGGGRGAIGIGQWRGPRIDAFRERYGKELRNASYEEQLDYVAWEMSHGLDLGARRADRDLRRPGIGAGEASEKFLRGFERPGPAGEREITEARSLADELSRRLVVQGGDKNVNVTQNTNISVTGGDGAAERVTAAQDRVNDNLVRNVVGAVR